MRILLTGSRGMVGRNLLEYTPADEFEFLTPSRQDLDLLDQHSVATYIRQKKPDMVIHAAGKVGGIQANMADPVGFLVQNTLMGIQMINEAHKAGVPYFINLASSCLYPREAASPLQEEQILTGDLEPSNEGYALAKIMATRLCQYISRMDASKNYTTLIPCNLYGRHDTFHSANAHMIPAVIRKIHDARQAGLATVEIWGDGEARREFMYVEDLADCVFTVAKKMMTAEALPTLMNVGLGQDFTVNEYYQIVADVLGYQGEFVHDLTKPVGTHQKLIDSCRARSLGWRPRTPLHQGIVKTYQYFLEKVKHG